MDKRVRKKYVLSKWLRVYIVLDFNFMGDLNRYNLLFFFLKNLF